MKNILLILLLLTTKIYSQNVGIGTVSPTHKLHINETTGLDPLKVEKLRIYSSENNFLVIDTNLGVVKYMPKDSVLSQLGNLDSIILSNVDTLYSFISDSLLNDTLWIDSLGNLLNDNDWNINSNGTGLEAAPSSNNIASGIYAIAAGFSDTADGQYAVVAGGRENRAAAFEATVGGGYSNLAWGTNATVAGGYNNHAYAGSSVVAGGSNNGALGNTSFVGGGTVNIASGIGSVVSGGEVNTVSGRDAVISGGTLNLASANYSSVLGGANNISSGQYSVSSGYENTAQSYGEWVGGVYATIGSGNSFSFTGSDRLFVLGNGSPTRRSNAVTILKNGNTGIGNRTNVLNPTNKLHLSDSINGNPLRMEDLNPVIKTTLDSILVINATGVVKRENLNEIRNINLSGIIPVASFNSTDKTLFVYFNNGGQAGTIVLPDAVAYPGRKCTVRSLNTNMANYTVTAVGGNVEGVASYMAFTGEVSVIFQSNGSDWWIISAY